MTAESAGPRRDGGPRWLVLLAAALVLASCSSGDAASDPGTSGSGASPPVVASDPTQTPGEAPTTPGNAGARAADLDLLIPAVDAVAAEFGQDVRFTEINVQSDLVNLFVSTGDGSERAVVFHGGELEVPDEVQPAPAGTEAFDLSSVDLDAASRFDELLRPELPESRLAVLTLTQTAETGLTWQAVMVGAQGTGFAVVLSPAGAILGALSD